MGIRRVESALRTVAYVEIEAFAMANLATKIEAGWLDEAPIYPDIETFPYAEFYPLMGATDSLCTFGFPCQPHSHAGKRKGGCDERWLFDVIADGLAVMRPRRIFIENVEGLLSSRMPNKRLCIDYIFGRLAGIGYEMADSEKKPLVGIFSASEVGAPHQRKRVFILGRLAKPGLSRQPSRGSGIGQETFGEMGGLADSRRQSTHGRPERAKWGAETGRRDDSEQRPTSGRNESAGRIGECGESQLEHAKSDGRGERRSESKGQFRHQSVTINGPLADAEGIDGRSEQQSRESTENGRIRPSGSGILGVGLANSDIKRSQGWNSEVLPECSSEWISWQSSSSDRWPARPGQEQFEWEPTRTTQPRILRGVNGNTGSLDANLNENEIRYKTSAGKVLFAVWDIACQEEIQRSFREYELLLSEEILRSRLFLSAFPQRITFIVWSTQASNQTESIGMRRMRNERNVRRSSQRQEPIKQLRRELVYAVCELSYEIALARGEEAGKGKEEMLSGQLFEFKQRPRLLSEALSEVEEIWNTVIDEKDWRSWPEWQTRVDRLRLCGNGVVPATAAKAWVILNERLK